jgi:biopolymer transport protein ExbB/TolQ
MIFLTLLTALGLSGVSAYYSVVGLAQIFPGSFWPIVFMGSVLEASKLVTVSWLYNNWKQCPFLIKSYLSIAVIILMLITSMGIFGFLSKAHLEHSADNAPLVDKIALLDEKIKTEKENVEANRKAIKQYDEVVDQTMGRSTDEKGAATAQAIRRSQQKDRTRILQEIQQSQSFIAKYSEERAPLSTELKKVEADIGPIKYIAALAYGSETTGDVIDKAVRMVIMLIIVVFDPLAILLLIAYNMSIKQKEDAEDFFERAKETAKKLNKDAKQVDDVIPEVVHVEKPVDPYAYLKQPFKHFENLKPMVAKREDTVEVKKDNMIVIDDITGETIPPITHEKVTIETHNTRNSVMYEEHHIPVEEPVKKLEPKYDYDEPYSFKEKEVRDAGKF